MRGAMRDYQLLDEATREIGERVTHVGEVKKHLNYYGYFVHHEDPENDMFLSFGPEASKSAVIKIRNNHMKEVNDAQQFETVAMEG